MQTKDLSSVFQAKGPFASVLADISRDSENGEHEHSLRVRAACDQLREQGADDAVVEIVSEALSRPTDRPAPVARLVVANADGVLHDELAGFRMDQAHASWGPLPDLAPWIRHRDSAVTFVLAVVDHEGGDVALYDSDVPEPEEEASVGGEERFVHKVPVGGWSALRYQHNTDNVWARNAEAVVDEVVSHLRRGHRLVLLAGDPQSRGIVRGHLEETDAELVELETGTRAEDGGDEALQQAIREALMDIVVRRRVGLLHEFRERKGRGEAVADGIDEVADAFVRGQVDTLLLDPARAAEHRFDPSSYPGLVLGVEGVEGLDEGLPADRALIAAAVATDASVSVVPSTALGGTPVAALLRWDQ